MVDRSKRKRIAPIEAVSLGVVGFEVNPRVHP